MAIIKCKMCGGDLTVAEGASIAECEYCGTMQTVPNQDNEKKLTLFSRANRLRLACEFDKASGVYENIVSEFPEEAEAYWGLVLCCYGIEYVDDPTTGKKVPTCHRSSFHSVLENSDFEQACENADAVARRVYRDEAKTIEEIRKGILEVSGKEPPYDIFICYKETDENGDRTIDSVLAQDVYDALTAKGYRVFFSRITLEDKLGTEYEPYIFAALNSAKVMLVFGTDYEYFNAVWVKNEWSRFLKLMAQDKSKHLIPCYKDVDAYDMPKEFQKLQAQDLNKVGAIQDLLRGIDKLLKSGETQAAPSAAPQIVAEGPTAASLLKRGQIFLEEGAWESADEYFSKVLDINPECAEAYMGKLCVERQCKIEDDLKKENHSLEASRNYQKAYRFSSTELKSRLESYYQSAKLNECTKEDELKQLRIKAYRTRKQIACGHYYTVGLQTTGKVVYAGQTYSAREDAHKKPDVQNWDNIEAVVCGNDYFVGLKADGTVVAAGNNSYGQCNITSWTDIIAIACGNSHTVGLKSNGTVVAIGHDLYSQCDVNRWSNIIAIACGDFRTVGLRSDGTVLLVGYSENCQSDVYDWNNIISIACGDSHVVGLKSDGTVVAAGRNIINYDKNKYGPIDAKDAHEPGACNVRGWHDIVAIACSNMHTVGLKSDGSVVATGYNEFGQCNVDEWTNIIAVEASYYHTVGLRADGTVVATGDKEYGRCDVFKWADIASIAAESGCTVGVRSDGTVVATGNNELGQCNVSGWRLFRSSETVQQEREEARQRYEQECAAAKERRRMALKTEQSKLQAELPTIKGLFSGGKRKQVEARLEEIKAELKSL